MAPDVTTLLAGARAGDAAATARLIEAVYDEMRRIAHAQRAPHRAHDTLNTTALVHEAYVKLVDGASLPFDARGHFFAAAARAMRQVLVDDARARTRAKRGGAEFALPLDDVPEPAATARPDAVLALDEALARFATFDPRAAQIVECRYFAGLTVEETAEALGISTATVKRDWAAARAWLYRALAETGGAA